LKSKRARDARALSMVIVGKVVSKCEYESFARATRLCGEGVKPEKHDHYDGFKYRGLWLDLNDSGEKTNEPETSFFFGLSEGIVWTVYCVGSNHAYFVLNPLK
jgi:hypothetical protein